MNFLDDPKQSPHMKLPVIDRAFGVAESTGQGKSKAIRTMFKIRDLDPRWTLPSQMDDNPRVWMLEVNGFIMDVRYAEGGSGDGLRKGAHPLHPCRPGRGGRERLSNRSVLHAGQGRRNMTWGVLRKS